MSDERPQPVTELIYPPQPSWLPAILAVGLGAILAGLFMGWFFAAVGAVLFLVALVKWIGDVGEDIRRLPRRQRVTSAVLPAAPMRRPRR